MDFAPACRASAPLAGNGAARGKKSATRSLQFGDRPAPAGRGFRCDGAEVPRVVRIVPRCAGHVYGQNEPGRNVADPGRRQSDRQPEQFAVVRRICLYQAHCAPLPSEKTYLLALSAIDADMFNFVDASGSSLAGPPGERKCGMIWRAVSLAENPGIGAFCVSSSQHMYIRADSVWANPYRIDFEDWQARWHRSGVALAEPSVTVDLDTGASISTRPDRPRRTAAAGSSSKFRSGR